MTEPRVFRALILTPQLVEFRAVVQSFRGMQGATRQSIEDLGNGGRECRIALDHEDAHVLFDVIKPPRVGRAEAAISVTRQFDRRGVPDLVVVAGGAGGLGPNLGSFVIAQEVLDLSTERRTGTAGVEFRAGLYHCDAEAVRVFCEVAEQAEVEFTVGQVFSSDYVIASSAFRDSLAESFPRVVAVEMEAGGVALAIARAGSSIRLAVIRSIVDRSDEQKRVDSDDYAGPSYLILGKLIANAVMHLARVPRPSTNAKVGGETRLVFPSVVSEADAPVADDESHSET